MHPSRTIARACAALALAAAAACAPRWVPPPGALDSPRFAVRPPPPGTPGYLATIAYIDTHVRYAHIGAQFVVGPTGDMCYSEEPGAFWCIPPKAVGRVAMDRYVEVHCAKWAPYCAYGNAPRLVPRYQFADKMKLRGEFEDRKRLVDAVDHLLYLMGRVKFPDPFASRRPGVSE
jgi:hypothetical protein